jgi:lipopolysaccharide transport system permease protein
MYTFQLSIVLTELFLFFIAITLAIVFLLIIDHPVTVTFFWLIPVMIVQSLFAFGLGVIASLFTPFFKDLKEIIPIITQLWFWMTPIIYMSSMIEKKYPLLLVYNPFYYFVEIYQNLFLYSKAPAFESLLIISSETIISIIIAGYLYKKMVPTIKDII